MDCTKMTERTGSSPAAIQSVTISREFSATLEGSA
jgi:hypothetical protein